MSDDEADPELLELLRQSLGLDKKQTDEISSDTGVLKDAEYIYGNAIDVSIDMWGTKGAAALIHKTMQERTYSTESWGHHELHPTQEEGFSDVEIVNFVFTMDLLNFSFWSEESESERFQVEYQGRRWTGYKSLLACLRRALDDGIPITTPSFWCDRGTADERLKEIFRSATEEQMPLLDERISMLREAGMELSESFGGPSRDLAARDESTLDTEPPTKLETGEVAMSTSDQPAPDPDVALQSDLDAGMSSHNGSMANTGADQNDQAGLRPPQQLSAQTTHKTTHETTHESWSEPDESVVRLIENAKGSAGRLVNLLAKHFPSFRDETRFDGRKVRFMKRAQIFVADLWAAMNGKDYAAFEDIDHLTMFADYRVPQMLHSLGVLVYSPPLDNAIRTQQTLPAGHSWEMQLRGCSIWAVELIRREILRQDAAATNVNAVLIDFFLYDLAKEKEAAGKFILCAAS